MAKKRLTLRSDLYDGSVRNAVDVMRASEATREKVVVELERMSKTLTDKLKLGNLTAAQDSRTRRLLSDTTNTIFSAYSTNERILQKDLLGVATFQAEAYPRVLEKAFRRRLARVSLSDTGIEVLAKKNLVLGAPTKDWWQQQGQRLSTSFASQVRIGLAAGENINQIVARIRGRETGRVRTLTDSDGNKRRIPETVGGIMDVTRANATTLVRTSFLSVVNNIIAAIGKKNKALFRGWRWVSVLDNKTTLICIARDGGLWDFDGEPLDESPYRQKYPGPPPAHWNCRSVVMPDPWPTDDEENKMPAYEEWLKEQPEDEQRDILGDARWKLWKEGKLTLSQLVDPSGRALTIEQLKRKSR